MIILVSGWRNHPFREEIQTILNDHYTLYRFNGLLHLVHGHCPTGVDHYADEWGHEQNIIVHRFPATSYGSWPSCGPRRNQAMVDAVAGMGVYGRLLSAYGPVRVLAFPQPGWLTTPKSGTRDLIYKAQARGLNVRVYEYHLIEEIHGQQT